MARRKSTRRKRKTSRLSMIAWAAITVISGGGLGGYFNPNMPILGPLLQAFRSGEKIDGSELARDAIAAYRGQPGQSSSVAGDQATMPGAGGWQQPAPDSSTLSPSAATGATATLASAQRNPRDKLLIATFNIQVFGESKLSKPQVVDVLAQIVRQFDLVAIQEVRAKSDSILPRFVQSVNADGSRYDFTIGPRLGRTVSTEQYAYVYDTTCIELDSSAVGTMQDQNDALHREPFVARFRARSTGPQPAFSFWLVNAHTDPDEVPQEVSALADAFQVMQSANPNEDDVILLGDLNANESQMGRIAQIPGIAWVVTGNVMTNTRRNRAYDNIIFDAQRTREYTGRWGVIDIEQAFGLSRKQALQVSDHLPVWAEFESSEFQMPAMAGGQIQRR